MNKVNVIAILILYFDSKKYHKLEIDVTVVAQRQMKAQY